jgi:hypothetical protein
LKQQRASVVLLHEEIMHWQAARRCREYETYPF